MHSDLKNGFIPDLNWDRTEAVIFDLDGTLVDSMWMWTDIDIEYLARFGHPFDPEMQKEIEGMSIEETARYFKKRYNIPSTLEEIQADWIRMSIDKYRHEVPLKPYAHEFLKFLKSRSIRTAIASSNAMDMDPKQRHEDVWRFAFTRTQPSYAYLFSRNLPGDDAGSFHSSDLWYWFGTLREGWRPWQKRDYDLMQEMMGYLLAFASNGDPNGEGRTKWPTAQSEQIMVFADGVTRTDGKEPAELKDAAAVIGW